MKRCPICGSGAERTNKVESVLADVAGFGAGLLAGLFMGPAGVRASQKTISKNLCENAEYECTNPQCGHKWIETRPT